MKEKLFFRKTDIIILLVILLIGLIFLLFTSFNNDEVSCQIIYDRKVVMDVDLNKNGEIKLPDFPNVTFEVKDGMIAFISSDCPDHVCVRTGFISKNSQTAVCLPNKLMIRINKSKNLDDDLDIIAG